jgi:putative nucleotidyltransferase with HDIG domain
MTDAPSATETTASVEHPGRDAAWELLATHTQSEALRGHGLAVEASMRHYATLLGEDADLWGVTGLLHDFDWEIHPTLEQHPSAGAQMLRDAGWPELIVRAVQSHADHVGVDRLTTMEHHLFACDELSGFVVAVARVRPEGFAGMAPKSVLKKLKTPSFAAAVSRDDVRNGAAEIGLELSAHVENVIAALAPLGDVLLAS